MENNKEKRKFAEGLCFDKLVWIFLVSCLLGYAIEELWCYYKLGKFESRHALIYGPLSVLYGMGTVLLTLTLYKIKSSKWYVVFGVSFVVCSFAEYIASWGQETFFGSVAWDYSHLPLNINGRVCLYYSLAWGALGLFWIKWAYPLMSYVIELLPRKIGIIITWLFVIFFVFDCFISAAAGARMDKRKLGVSAKNSYEEFLDEHYDDERMHKIYANSKDK